MSHLKTLLKRLFFPMPPDAPYTQVLLHATHHHFNCTSDLLTLQLIHWFASCCDARSIWEHSEQYVTKKKRKERERDIKTTPLGLFTWVCCQLAALQSWGAADKMFKRHIRLPGCCCAQACLSSPVYVRSGGKEEGGGETLNHRSWDWDRERKTWCCL